MFSIKRTLIASVLFFVVAGNCQDKADPQDRRDGAYVALETISNLSPGVPNARWFHENTLVIRGDEAILDEVPVWFENGKKFYSASDGAFLTYRARFIRKGERTVLQMRLVRSAYLPVRVGHDPYKEIMTRPVKFLSDGIEIDGVHYTLSSIAPETRNRLSHLLDTEPM